MNDAQHGFREKARSFNSTIVARNVGLEEDGQVPHRVAAPQFSTFAALNMGPEIEVKYSEEVPRDSREAVTTFISTFGASQRGAEVRMSSTNDEQRKHRDAAEPQFSIIDALQRGAGNDSNPEFSTVLFWFVITA